MIDIKYISAKLNNARLRWCYFRKVISPNPFNAWRDGINPLQ
tara:strand:+ start:127 stop:252 length:126 start_codon:yes stop_codon:yes gene_type:complete